MMVNYENKKIKKRTYECEIVKSWYKEKKTTLYLPFSELYLFFYLNE